MQMPHLHLNLLSKALVRITLSDHVTNAVALEKRQGVCFGLGLCGGGVFLIGFWLNFFEIKYEKKKWRAGQTQMSI